MELELESRCQCWKVWGNLINHGGWPIGRPACRKSSAHVHQATRASFPCLLSPLVMLLGTWVPGRRAADSTQHWCTTLYPLLPLRVAEPWSASWYPGSPVKLSVSKLPHLTWFPGHLPDRALCVSELLSALRRYVHGEQGGPSSFHLSPRPLASLGATCLSSHQSYHFPTAFSDVCLSVFFIFFMEPGLNSDLS